MPSTLWATGGETVPFRRNNYTGDYDTRSVSEIYTQLKTRLSITYDFLLFVTPVIFQNFYIAMIVAIDSDSASFYDPNFTHTTYDWPSEGGIANSPYISTTNRLIDNHCQAWSSGAGVSANTSTITVSGITFYSWGYGDGERDSYYYYPSGVHTIKYNDVEIIPFNFKPISYLKSSVNHLKLSMIKESETNHGDPVLLADPDNVIQRTSLETDLASILKTIPVGTIKPLVNTAANNFLAVQRVEPTSSPTQYGQYYGCNLLHYVNGIIDSTLTVHIDNIYEAFTAPDGFKDYLSYLIDDEQRVVRPSIIHIYTVSEVLYCSYNQLPASPSQSRMESYYSWLAGGYMLGEPENPYDWDEPSGESDEDGTHDKTSDTIGEPDTPTISVSDAGFITLYTPTSNQIHALSSYMWSELDITNLRRLFADPMDCLISLNILPFDIESSGTSEIHVGNIGTGINANVAASQWKSIDMGSIDMKEFFAGYMDYAPYTKIAMYLPYIGIVSLNADDVMSSTISLKYRIDILTGACVAYLMVNRTADAQHTAVNAPLYTFTGNCAVSIPVTSASYGTVFQSIVGMASTAGAVGAAAITGGMSAPIALGAAATLSSNAMNMKPEVSRSGSLGSTAGFLNQQHAYLIVTRPNQCRAENQEQYTGFPAHIAYTLSSLTGYTEVESIHLEGIPCTESEYTEIENLLKGGVII